VSPQDAFGRDAFGREAGDQPQPGGPGDRRPGDDPELEPSSGDPLPAHQSELDASEGPLPAGPPELEAAEDRLPAHPPELEAAEGPLPGHSPELRGSGAPRVDPDPGLGGLLIEAVGLFRSHLWMFVAIAGGVAAVVNLILAFGLGELTSRYRGQTSQSVGFIKVAAAAAVTTPLITAMLAQVVLDIRSGEAPSAGRAVQRGLDLFAPILLTILLYIGAVIAGFLLIVPGIYLAVSWYFVAQAVVVDDRRGVGALARSGELVKGNWWRALAAGLLFNILVAIPSQLLNLAFDAAARSANAEGVLVLGQIVFQAFSLPFVAIGATLFYLRLRDEPRPVPIGR